MPGDDQQSRLPPPSPAGIPPPPSEPRKKRAKIVSACGECRRKKTKCNGEQPCRSCAKSGVSCVYPSATQSQNDDKRNVPSKAALEAIEERLKAIEDMLRVILQSQPIPNASELDPMLVNQFLNNTTRTSSSSSSSSASPPPPTAPPPPPSHLSSSPPPPSHLHYPPPPHTTSSSSTTTVTTTMQPHYHAQPHHHHYPPPQQQQTDQDFRLPSIRNLSSAYHPHQLPATDSSSEPLDIPPPAMPMHDYQLYRPRTPSASGRPHPSEAEDYSAFQPVKKRKR